MYYIEHNMYSRFIFIFCMYLLESIVAHQAR
jgi:hypothetical protein